MTALGITKELVQGIVVSLSVVVGGMLANVTSVADGIVDWTVGSWLLRSVIAIVSGVVTAVVGCGAGMHLGTMMGVVVTSGGSFTTLPVSRALTTMPMLFWGSKEDRVVGMGLDMFLQVLRTLEGFTTEVTFVRLQWNVNSNVRGDMVTLHSGGAALIPATREIEVVCALTANVLLANVFKESLSGWASL